MSAAREEKSALNLLGGVTQLKTHQLFLDFLTEIQDEGEVRAVAGEADRLDVQRDSLSSK